MNNQAQLRSYEPILDQFRRKYHTALASGKEVSLSSFFSDYKKMAPLLHKGLSKKHLDISTLKYCLDRLPCEIHQVQRIIIAQSKDDLEREKVVFDGSWQEVTAVARRRQTFYNSQTKTLIFLIVSDADIDDLVNLLIAYKLEWIKLYYLLEKKHDQFLEKQNPKLLDLSDQDWQKIKTALGGKWEEIIADNKQGVSDIFLKLIGYTWIGSRQIAQGWWQKVVGNLLTLNIVQAPTYFVSSNFHSLVNIIGGYVGQHQNEIFAHLDKYPELKQEWSKIQKEDSILRTNDFLYYFSKIYFQDFPEKLKEKEILEENLGIKKFRIDSNLSGRVQSMPVSAIAGSKFLDPYLSINDKVKLGASKARIINIDYPLGFGAYFLLSEVLENLKNIKGIYIVGKAAILAGQVGDIQIPKVVFDETTANVYFVKNIFNQFFPFKTFQSAILKDQKAIAVYGTFLETKNQLENYIKSGFNIVEMESGPYLTAISEVELRTHFPENKVIHLNNLPFDLGIINYASDNPLSEETLGSGSLALKGIESTYLALLSVVQRIIEMEEKS